MRHQRNFKTTSRQRGVVLFVALILLLILSLLGVTAARIGWRPENRPRRAWIEGEVGSMDGSGTNLSTSDPGGRWYAAGVGFGVGWPMTPMRPLSIVSDALTSGARSGPDARAVSCAIPAVSRSVGASRRTKPRSRSCAVADAVT